MTAVKQSALRSLYTTFPGSYFLNDNIVATVEETLIDQMHPAHVRHPERIEATIRAQLNDANRRLSGPGSPPAVGPSDRFIFLTPRQLRATVGARTFLCRSCGHVANLFDDIRRGRLSEEKLRCPECRRRLAPVIQFLVHGRCGTILQLGDDIPSCPTCHSRLRLRINTVSFINSHWFCPLGHSLPGWMADPVRFCPRCRGLAGDARKMKAIPAPRAVHAVGLKIVDVGSSASWREIVAARLKAEMPDILELILEEVPEPYRDAIRRSWLTGGDEQRNMLRQSYLSRHPEVAEQEVLARLGGEPPEETQRLVAEYKGVLDAAHKSAGVLASEQAAYIRRKFGLIPRYVRSIPVQNVVYGRQYSGTDKQECIIRPFRSNGRYIALAHGVETEGILFEFDMTRLARWAAARHGLQLDEAGLNARLLRVPADPDAPDLVVREALILVHTLSHLLMRESEVHTGYSRDSLAELLFVPAAAFLIFTEEGNELGILETACRSRNVTGWIAAAFHNAQLCPLDPVCGEGKITGRAACHSCCFVGEKNCNNLWNGCLDRALVQEFFATR